jgi:uracil-DNA glycosylase
VNRIKLAHQTDFAGWRDAAREALRDGVPPHMLDWRVEGDGTPDPVAAHMRMGAAEAGADIPRVPKAFIPLAQTVVLHRDPGRFALLYRLLWALRRQPKLLEDATYPDVHLAAQVAKAIDRDIRRMQDTLRFREVATPGGEAHFIAWFAPEHYIVEAAAPFFARRFAGTDWTILTPDRIASCHGGHLTFAPGAAHEQAPTSDRLEALWRAYYAHAFGPPPVKRAAVTPEMPRREVKAMPEAAAIGPLIGPLIQPGPVRAAVQASVPVAVPAPPGTLAEARAAAAGCRRCALWKTATQTVFGEGPEGARLMLVGEQPGDREDLSGAPFVGPAGGVLDRALAEAGIPRSEIYLTNAVKHFKFEPRGKFRLHKTPDTPEIEACRWWLEAERRLVRPHLTVALGASAAQALLGRRVVIGRERGRPSDLPQGGALWVTVHPSYLLRIPDEATQAREYALFVADLAGAWAWRGASVGVEVNDRIYDDRRTD